MDDRERLSAYFPKWELLSPKEQEQIVENLVHKTYKKGEIVHRSEQDCKGLLLIESGQLRPYIVSEDGREITLFRVRSGELCILTASCLMDSFAMDILIEALEETKVLIVPSAILHPITEQHMEMELYMYRHATEKFADMMWMMQQILFYSADKRVASFLWDEFCAMPQSEKAGQIQYTHEEIAKLIGSAREVVSRVLKYMEEDGVIILGRGKIQLVDKKKLKMYIGKC